MDPRYKTEDDGVVECFTKFVILNLPALNWIGVFRIHNSVQAITMEPGACPRMTCPRMTERAY